MAVVTPRIAPFINVTFWVTSEWWEQPRNHRGLDIATAIAGGSVPLYSMSDGVVVRSDYSSSYGNVVIIKATNGMGFLYAHMRDLPAVKVGQSVSVGQYIGQEGSTGDSTGLHLHVEMQDLTNHEWIYQGDKSIYSNPAEFMGIPNVEGTECYYSGTPGPIPPTPTGETKKKRFPWVLYSQKLRNKQQSN